MTHITTHRVMFSSRSADLFTRSVNKAVERELSCVYKLPPYVENALIIH